MTHRCALPYCNGGDDEADRCCPAPGCVVPYEDCYQHRADEVVWDFAMAHGQAVRDASQTSVPAASEPAAPLSDDPAQQRS